MFLTAVFCAIVGSILMLLGLTSISQIVFLSE